VDQGFSGDQGVQLFLIASGFGLTWGLLNKQAGKPLNIGKFYLRRTERIYPLWWGAHILFIGFWFLTGWGLSLYSRATILSLLGIVGMEVGNISGIECNSQNLT
jgi:peptidoglycan/LPS O-acetylase OafA/YrhL